MGDPKFSRKTYETPAHPWQGERIKAEKEIVRAFGLKNKTEVWKAETILRNLRKQSRDLQARLRSGDRQAQVEAENLLAKCGRLGYLPVGSDLNDILALKDEDVLSRRLQTIVYEKGLASTIRQARQMITHGHIFMNGHRVTVPGYLVTRAEEASIEYNPASPYNDEMHPMRMSAEQAAALQASRARAAVEAPEEEFGGDEAPMEDESRWPERASGASRTSTRATTTS